MIFEKTPVADSEGALLAHGITAGTRRFKKGHQVNAKDIQDMLEAGVKAVSVIHLEAGDIDEDSAANALAEKLNGAHIETTTAFTGRSNLIATADGVLAYDETNLHRLNLIDESITLAMLPAYSRVHQGQMMGTVKIIPFAVQEDILRDALAVLADPPLAQLRPFRPLRVALIETTMGTTPAKVSDKLVRITEQRLTSLGCSLASHAQCDHEEGALAGAIAAATPSADLVLVAGASATTDRRDIVPAGLTQAGGTITHFGMPVDPGNLLLLGKVGEIPVIGLPGCAKSPKLNGFDWVLERLVAGIDLSAEDIMRMGAGGLLKDISSRPQPRRHSRKGDTAMPHKLATITLAAGKSSRMGGANKLLQSFDGATMIRKTAEQICGAGLGPVILVTGRDAEEVTQAVDGLDVAITHNPDFATGMASSLRTGLNALPDDTEGVLVCLGDMPLVTAHDLQAIAAQFDPVEGRSICVPTHGGKWGNPILWGEAWFDEMRAITGDKGARALLHEYADRVHEVPLETTSILQDFDTPDSLAGR